MQFRPKINAFLAAIRVMPNVTRAALAAKINRSQHYAKMKSSPEYAAAFQEARQMRCDAISDVAVTRATGLARSWKMKRVPMRIRRDF
jgi:hypothetical protein